MFAIAQLGLAKQVLNLQGDLAIGVGESGLPQIVLLGELCHIQRIKVLKQRERGRTMSGPLETIKHCR